MTAHNSVKDKDCIPKMLTHALVLAALVHYSAVPSSDALLVASSHQIARFSSALSYSNSEQWFSPQPRPNSQQRRGGAEKLQLNHIQQEEPSTDEKSHRAARRSPSSRRIPRRAMPHVRNASHAEAATRAGYIIRHCDTTQPESGEDMSAINNRKEAQQQRQRQTEMGVIRPLRSIRRIVHRSPDWQPIQPPNGLQQDDQSQIRIQAPNKFVDLHVRNNRPNAQRYRMSLTQNPQLDEFLDKPEQLLPSNEEARKGNARRVTFKATRESSKTILSKSVASLTKYMTQPVSQYSLLSFHDAEGGGGGETSKNNVYGNNTKQSMSRRWLVRRLTTDEARGYISSSAEASSEDDEMMDESNLFRLAVPLLPLIGWDLTPVIDLEVIPPKNDNKIDANLDNESGNVNEETIAINDSLGESESTYTSSKWEPLRDIRERIRPRGDDANTASGDVASSPAVKIRSLRVSLLSTQEEVKEIMSNDNNNNSRRPNNQRSGSTMQKEALDMVSKVEEWLRPHITFEAELSWNDDCVTVKSTAVTSLTIPKMPSDILRKTVPSAFLVKRLGATLTSQALAICLPRFLRQLEKDYVRWSGIGLSSEGSAEESSDGIDPSND